MKSKQKNTQRIERTFGMLLASAGLALVVFDPALLLLIVTVAPLAAATAAPFFL